jgi:NAD(P)-dependent dehydrogenase (short-subunit alcohol dehydrogenase family)
MDPLASFDLTGRVAIVTGGGRGLGRAMSLGLASVGAKVVATGRTESDLRSVVDEIEAAGGEALAVVADVGNLDDGARIIAATVERFAGIDILVNNAVEAGFSMVAQLTSELWDRAYNVNVKGPVFLCNAALPYLERSSHAAIVNVVSPAMWIGGPNMALYRATKSALWGMSVVMSKEWGPKGVRVNGLAPGPFETTNSARQGRENAVRNATLFKRIATFEEIVPPLLYLVSDASKFMTGSILTIDGGVSP